MKNNKHFKKYWRERQDWTGYTSPEAINHPHRKVIVEALKTFPWLSLLEVGMGGGANLVNIIRDLPGRQVGGIHSHSVILPLTRARGPVPTAPVHERPGPTYDAQEAVNARAYAQGTRAAQLAVLGAPHGLLHSPRMLAHHFAITRHNTRKGRRGTGTMRRKSSAFRSPRARRVDPPPPLA